MCLKYPRGGPEYILLYTLDCDDAENDAASTRFGVDMKMVEDDVDFESYQVHSDDGPGLSNMFNKQSSKRSNPTCLEFGPIFPTSVLKITLYKEPTGSCGSSRCITGDKKSASRLEYATASIPLQTLRAAQHYQSSFDVETEGVVDLAASMKGYQRVDYIINMKMHPMIGAADALSQSKQAKPLSPESRIRAAEDAYHAALQSAIRSGSCLGDGMSRTVHGEYLKSRLRLSTCITPHLNLLIKMFVLTLYFVLYKIIYFSANDYFKTSDFLVL